MKANESAGTVNPLSSWITAFKPHVGTCSTRDFPWNLYIFQRDELTLSQLQVSGSTQNSSHGGSERSDTLKCTEQGWTLKLNSTGQ